MTGAVRPTYRPAPLFAMPPLEICNQHHRRDVFDAHCVQLKDRNPVCYGKSSNMRDSIVSSLHFRSHPGR